MQSKNKKSAASSDGNANNQGKKLWLVWLIVGIVALIVIAIIVNILIYKSAGRDKATAQTNDIPTIKREYAVKQQLLDTDIDKMDYENIRATFLSLLDLYNYEQYYDFDKKHIDKQYNNYKDKFTEQLYDIHEQLHEEIEIEASYSEGGEESQLLKSMKKQDELISNILTGLSEGILPIQVYERCKW